MRNVLILGSGRSGTSLLAGLLARSGYWLGGVPYPAREANPKGFFETAEVNGVNELILAGVLPRHPRFQSGQRWLATLPLDTEVRAAPEVAQRIERLVARPPWCFKDPRFSLTLPAWRPFTGDAAHLCVFRDPAITAASIVHECRREPYLQSLELGFERALSVWRSMYEHILRRHAGEGEWSFFHYDQLFRPEGHERLIRATGASIEPAFADPALRRTSSDRAVPREIQSLYAELCDRAGWRAGGRTQVAAAAPKGIVAPGPELSVILCTYDRRETLTRSIASFEAQDAQAGSFELVVVDDGSKDGTAELLDGWSFKVPAQVVHRENGGLAAARNSALEVARGKLVLFVNDDTIASPGLVSAHLAHHAGRATPAAVLGTFEQPRSALDNALMRFLEDADLVFRYAEMTDGATYDPLHFWTCNVSVSADLVAKAGGFDESFRHYGCEDLDLGYRLEELGCRVVYDAHARAEHDHVMDLAALERRTRLVARAFVRLFAKHPSALENADWGWVRDHTIESLDAKVAEGLGRLSAIRAAAAELSRIDVGALEHPDAGLAPLVGPIGAALESAVRELSTAWWLDGFAAGLREHGKQAFAELRSAEALRADRARSRRAAAAAARAPGRTIHIGGPLSETAYTLAPAPAVASPAPAAPASIPIGAPAPALELKLAGTPATPTAPAREIALVAPPAPVIAAASAASVAAPAHAIAPIVAAAPVVAAAAPPAAAVAAVTAAPIVMAPASPAPGPAAASVHQKFDTDALGWLVGMITSEAPPPPAVEPAPRSIESQALDRLRAIAAEGESDLATIEGIRLCAALAPAVLAHDRRASALQADVLSDLAVLRYRAGDRAGCLALLDRALVVQPMHQVAIQNRIDIERSTASRMPPEAEVRIDAGTLIREASTRDLLEISDHEVGLAGKMVLEIGSAIPPTVARERLARQWSSVSGDAPALQESGYERIAANLRRLPWTEGSFDAVLVSRSLVHTDDLGPVLGEIARVLRPGGVLVTSFAPIWSSAVGHHLWEVEGCRERGAAFDQLLPRFAHLLLSEPELAWYLRVVLEEHTAQRGLEHILRGTTLNRLFETDYVTAFARSGLDLDVFGRHLPWTASHVPPPKLRAELDRVHPGRGDFGTPGLRGVLQKPAFASAPTFPPRVPGAAAR